MGLLTVATTPPLAARRGQAGDVGSPTSPVMCCGGLPYPRSSSAFAADTLAAGANFGLVIIDTSVWIASPVCLRQVPLPRRLLWAFLQGFRFGLFQMACCYLLLSLKSGVFMAYRAEAANDISAQMLGLR